MVNFFEKILYFVLFKQKLVCLSCLVDIFNVL